MKNIWIYFLGILSGVALIFLVSYLINKTKSDDITFFDEPGEIITAGSSRTVNSFEIFLVIDEGVALATGDEWFSRDLIVLLWNENGEPYYDNQSVVASNGKCFRQIGIYKYKSRDKMHRTIPVVTLMDVGVLAEDNVSGRKQSSYDKIDVPDGQQSLYDNGMSFFDEPSEVMSDKSYKVTRVLDKGSALARGKSEYGSSYYGLEVLLWDEEANYYDDQIVKAPNGKCFRQIGIYKSGLSTYPIVTLKNGNSGQKSEAKKTTSKIEKPKNNNFETNSGVEPKTEPQTNESNNVKLDKNKAYRLVRD